MLHLSSSAVVVVVAVAGVSACFSRVTKRLMNFLMTSLLGIVKTSVAAVLADGVYKYCTMAACVLYGCCILFTRTSASVFASSEFCFCSSTMQNCRALCALIRLVSCLQSALTANFSGCRQDTISEMTVKSASDKSESMPDIDESFLDWATQLEESC